MNGTWYPSPSSQLEAERHGMARSHARDEDELDWTSALLERAADGDIDALMALREELGPIDYAELGWGD